MKKKILRGVLTWALYAIFLAATAGATIGVLVLGNNDPVITGVLLGLLVVILIKAWR